MQVFDERHDSSIDRPRANRCQAGVPQKFIAGGVNATVATIDRPSLKRSDLKQVASFCRNALRLCSERSLTVFTPNTANPLAGGRRNLVAVFCYTQRPSLSASCADEQT